MRNLVILNQKLLKLSENIIETYIDEVSKIYVLLYDDKIEIYNFKDNIYNFEFNSKNLIKTIKLKKKLSSPVKFFLYKTEEETFHILLQNGKYLSNDPNNLDKQRETIMNELNEEAKIVTVKISPNLEHIVIVYDDYSINLLNYEFDVINRCEVDDGDGTKGLDLNGDLKDACISFRGDSSYFVCHYTIGEGSKTLVRDMKLNIVKGPARADGKVVFSTAEGVNKSKYKINIKIIVFLLVGSHQDQ